MSDQAARSNLLSFIGGKSDPGVTEETPANESRGKHSPPDVWSALWATAAAHVVELGSAGVIDDAGFSAIARSLLGTRELPVTDSTSPRALATYLDERIESQVPASVSGAATLGLSREEWLATAGRLVWRDAALVIFARMLDTSESALVLAETHVVTIMPAFTGGRPVQPTTLAHYLGAVIGPLRTARERLIEAYARLNRSPMGAGMLAGDVLAADRQDLAQRLGFNESVPNTMDALASVEDLIAYLDAVASAIGPLGRFVREVGVWIRTDPTSFVLDAGWTIIPEPAHPALFMSERLDSLEQALAAIEDQCDSLRRQLRRLGYGPLAGAYDVAIGAATRLASPCLDAMGLATELFSTGLIVNRAYLGNRAGRGYTTAADLSTFLMTEEQIPPTAARSIAVLVLARLKETSLEVSGITSDMIDSAALMIIGREIKVEMESLGRFLAPRRYLERRQVTGSPAPEMTRAWLAAERSALVDHEQWLTVTHLSVETAVAELATTIETAASESSEG
ncbi:MAG: lyase family protein [Thermomicrobiales bacterium]